jgi:hypothetical protein
MFSTTIEIDETEIKKRLGTLSEYSGKVMSRAVNRAYPTGKTTIARETRKRYLITAKEINDSKTLHITKATPSSPTAILEYTGGHRNLAWWNNKRAVTPNTIIHWSHGIPNVRTYKAAVMRGTPKQELIGEDNNKPFIQRVRKGERSDFTGLFRRNGSDRNSKLVSVQAPAIPQIIKNEEVMAQFRRAAGPMLQKRLEHEIDVVLKGVVR